MLDLSHDGHAPIVNSGPRVIAWTVATRSLGAGHLRLILRHLLPNTLPVLIVAASLVFLPGVCIFITVLAANLFGDAVRDAFDPRLR